MLYVLTVVVGSRVAFFSSKVVRSKSSSLRPSYNPVVVGGCAFQGLQTIREVCYRVAFYRGGVD